jgi:hypothetical protein
VTLARKIHALKGSQSRLLCSLYLGRKIGEKIEMALIDLILIKHLAVFIGGA